MQQHIRPRLPGFQWWHSPSALTLFFLVPFFLAVSAFSSDIIERAPVLQVRQVYVSLIHIIEGVTLLLALSVGSFFGERSTFRFTRTVSNRSLDFLFWCCTLAYAVWFGPMLAANPHLIGDTLIGAKGAMYTVRETAPNIPGLTTLSQFGISFAIIYAFKIFHDREVMPPRFKKMMAVVFGLAFFRAAVFSERIAVIEVAVPFFSIYCASQRTRYTVFGVLVKLFPYSLYAAAPLFFGIFEYNRSWKNHYVNVYDNFWHFLIDRFLLYYATALNNICALIDISPNPTFRGEWTLNWLYKFPIIGQFIAPHQRSDLWFIDFLRQHGSPEYNNTTGLLTVLYDWSWPIAIVLMATYGIIAGTACASFKSGAGFARYVYPVFLYSLFEMMRIGYIYDGRAFAALTGVLVAVLFWARPTTRAASGSAIVAMSAANDQTDLES